MNARRCPLPLAVVLTLGCSGARPAPRPNPLADAVRSDPRPVSPAMNPDRAAVHAWNEHAREGSVSDDYFGTLVEDPYRSLEEESAATSEWIEAQTKRTRTALDRLADPGRRRRLAELLGIGVIARPAVAGNLVFYTKRDGEREQPALCVLPTAPARSATPAEPRVLVDPQALGERVALDWFEPSPRGKLVAYGLSDNGDERSTLHVMEVATGNVRDEQIPRTKWSRVSWLPDESGFYYTRYPTPAEPGYDADAEDTYFPRLFFHALGTDPVADPLVFGGEQGTDFPSADVSDDGRWLVVNVFRGWSASDVYLLDRRAREAQLVPVIQGRDNLTTGRVLRGKLLLLTNIDAPRYRIVAADPREAARPERWREVVPQGPGAIEGFAATADRLVVHTIEEVRSVLRVYRRDGRAAGTLELPARGSVDGLSAAPDGHHVAVTWSSFFYPPGLYGADLRAGAARLARLDGVASDIDESAYELEQASVPSRDGTPINVFLVHRRGMARDGSNPVLLTGYGGFNISLLPGFARNALYWIERGGVYAVANLRGGGEGGEQWHRAGNLGNKERVFEDFEAVIRWLSASGISRPEKIGITGGSNGGLLMGAMITRIPEAFAAAATYVGLYDMLRYDRFPPAELWVTEYGSARASREQFEWLSRYSPYHRIRPGVRYPAVLVETADHDSRVYWGHSTKFAARLQEATASDRPIWFYLETRVGHGAGTRLTDLVHRYDRSYAFVEDALGMRAAPTEPAGGRAPPSPPPSGR